MGKCTNFIPLSNFIKKELVVVVLVGTNPCPPTLLAIKKQHNGGRDETGSPLQVSKQEIDDKLLRKCRGAPPSAKEMNYFIFSGALEVVCRPLWLLSANKAEVNNNILRLRVYQKLVHNLSDYKQHHLRI